MKILNNSTFEWILWFTVFGIVVLEIFGNGNDAVNIAKVVLLPFMIYYCVRDARALMRRGDRES